MIELNLVLEHLRKSICAWSSRTINLPRHCVTTATSPLWENPAPGSPPY